jgi:glutamate/tyrosine decarboxylase-like PLP-dependent enzyme
VKNEELFWPHDEELLQSVMDWSKHRIIHGQDPLTAARSVGELNAEMGETVTPEGIGGSEALRLFSEVLVAATRAQDDPMNLAYIPAAPTEASLVFDLAVSAAEVFAGTWEAGAGAIAAENQALAWLVSLLDWPESAGGCFVSGATLGNLSALVAARDKAKRSGRSGSWRFAATTDAHSSVAAAARVMDCGVLEVPGDPRGRMTGEALEAALVKDSAGVFAVVVSSGTTNAGVIDDLAGVAEVCQRRDLWLHVDGAYGGAALAAPSARNLFSGVEFADSFVVDPHKWLFAPYDCCALLYRQPEHGANAHSQFASYLDQVDRNEWNPADYAIHLTRRARGLPFWFSLATYGTQKYEEAIEATLAVTQGVATEIKARDYLHLVMEPDLSVLLFERTGWVMDDYVAWSNDKATKGVVLCVPTTWQGRPVLRMCFVNPLTQIDQVVEVLETLAC